MDANADGGWLLRVVRRVRSRQDRTRIRFRNAAPGLRADVARREGGKMACRGLPGDRNVWSWRSDGCQWILMVTCHTRNNRGVWRLSIRLLERESECLNTHDFLPDRQLVSGFLWSDSIAWRAH